MGNSHIERFIKKNIDFLSQMNTEDINTLCELYNRLNEYISQREISKSDAISRTRYEIQEKIITLSSKRGNYFIGDSALKKLTMGKPVNLFSPRMQLSRDEEKQFNRILSDKSVKDIKL